MLKRIADHPILVRVLPFAVFAGLTLVQGQFGDAGQYWIYAAKTAIGAWMLWLFRSHIREMRWNVSWEAVAAGIAVFLIWVGLDGWYPMLADRHATFNPERTFGNGAPLAWAFIALRLLGSSLIVPPMEELFYRSFLYRYFIDSDFLKIPLSRFDWRAFLIVGAAFGIGHYEWLPGILCAFAYQAVVCRKGRLGDAITAHAITNLLLGLWVIGRNAYQFW